MTVLTQVSADVHYFEQQLEDGLSRSLGQVGISDETSLIILFLHGGRLEYTCKLHGPRAVEITADMATSAQVHCCSDFLLDTSLRQVDHVVYDAWAFSHHRIMSCGRQNTARLSMCWLSTIKHSPLEDAAPYYLWTLSNPSTAFSHHYSCCSVARPFHRYCVDQLQASWDLGLTNNEVSATRTGFSQLIGRGEATTGLIPERLWVLFTSSDLPVPRCSSGKYCGLTKPAREHCHTFHQRFSRHV